MNSVINAVYLGTFDPLTAGHYDVIVRAAAIFNSVIIGIGKNKAKDACFSVSERIEMISSACAGLKNVSVEAFEGLAVNFADRHQARVMVRGLRTEADYVYEMQMAMMNRILDRRIETVFIPTRQDLSHVSSSLVKEVAALGGNISELVPKEVYNHLRKKFPTLP